MSRTIKDAPYDVKKLYWDDKKPEFIHNHDLLGKVAVRYHYWQVVIPLVDEDTASQQRLDDKISNLLYRWMEASQGRYFILEHKILQYYPLNHRDGARSVRVGFRFSEKVRYSQFCTDARHYNRVDKTDKRDGGLATCTPLIEPAQGKLRRKQRSPRYRQRKANLRKLKYTNWRDDDFDDQLERLELTMYR